VIRRRWPVVRLIVLWCSWTLGVTGVSFAAPDSPAPAQATGADVATGEPTRGRTPGRRAAPEPAARGSVAEVEQLFDRYVLGQARGALQLSADEMRLFGPRLQRLQTLRRRAARQRQQLLAEINTLTRGGAPVDEAVLAARLEALEASAREARQQIEEARRLVEGSLTIEQRARFRVFEQRMERRKLELIAEARQRARSGRAGAAPRGGVGQ
jgi:hypothetical protein